MRITNKKRFIVSLSVLFVIIFSLCSLITTKVFSYTSPTYHKIIISEGDTLWKIAKRGEGNINKNIYEIQRINNLNSSSLYIGQELLIPFEY